MSQISGYVEFWQMVEWYAVIDIGVLLVQNSILNARIWGVEYGPPVRALVAPKGLPSDCSVGFMEKYAVVRGHVFGETTATYRELAALDPNELVGVGGDGQTVGELFRATNFDTMLALMRVLADKFGCDMVRVVAYFD